MATLQHTDELYHILEDEICTLKILPGEALSENQLCKRFGVSRTPIRSVLQRLEQNRFVQIIPCKGTIVTAIDIGYWRGGSAHLPACCRRGHGVPGFCAELLAHGDPCGRTPL